MKSFQNWKEFQEYLRVLTKSSKKKPFDCPFLAILAEELFYRRSDAWKSVHHSTGCLFCSELTGLCSTKGGQNALALDENGKIEIPCAYNGSYLTFSLTSFEAKK